LCEIVVGSRPHAFDHQVARIVITTITLPAIFFFLRNKA